MAETKTTDAPSVPIPVLKALDFLLASNGDHSTEGEAMQLRFALLDLADEPLHEDPPARVSNERMTPEQEIEAAERTAAAAQAELDRLRAKSPGKPKAGAGAASN